MKTITIIQPWAALAALGEKRFETRSWKTLYRGDIAIHAGQKINKAYAAWPPLRTILARHGDPESFLRTGVILAVSRLEDCVQVIENTGTEAVLENGQVIGGQEFALGNFTIGRFAWQLADVRLLAEPIPAKGRLGLWEHPFQ